MAFVLFKDSFDRYKLGSFGDATLFDNFVSRYTTVNSLSCSIIADGRNGQALRIPFGSSIGKTLPHSARWVIGRAYRMVVPTTGDDSIYELLNNTNQMFRLLQNLDGTLQLRAGNSTTIGISSRALHPGRWYSIEVDITISGATPLIATAELRINGHVEGSGSGSVGLNASQNLSFGATGGVDANYHLFAGTSGAGGSGGCDVDDLYIKNEAGYEGDVRDLALYPNGDGGTLNWTPSAGVTHYDRVNTHPVDLTKWLATATPGNIDIWSFEDCPAFSGTIVAINISVLARKDDEGTKSFKIVVGDLGTEAESDEFFVSSLTPEYYEYSMKVDPATGLAWTQAGFNAKKFGVKCIS